MATSRADGTDERLLPGPLYGVSPSWSPDGRRILASSFSHEIVVFNADGSGRRVVSDEPDASTDLWSGPVWSPDGRTIVFASYGTGTGELFAIGADGRGRRQLTRSPGDDVDASWSPDGRRIAFASARAGNLDIYTMAPDGSAVTRLTTSPQNERSPDWSPDGSRIAFIRFGHDLDELTDLFVMFPNGSGLRRLAHGYLDTVSWSPDGTRLALTAATDEITVIDPDGVTINTFFDYNVYHPDWQPLPCTLSGTAGSDELTGTPGNDVICGHGGRRPHRRPRRRRHGLWGCRRGPPERAPPTRCRGAQLPFDDLDEWCFHPLIRNQCPRLHLRGQRTA